MSPFDIIVRRNGKPLTISWSAVESFDHERGGCNRKWWYAYMESKRTSNEATIVGGHTHDTAEAYLKGLAVDKDTRWWRILEPGLEYAPTPEQVREEGWLIEEGWTAKSGLWCGPLLFAGRVDFAHKPTAVVGDWKTTGNPEFRWSKTPKQLARHGQPLLYAKALWYGEAPPTHVRFQHINMVTKGKPQAMEVWAAEEDGSLDVPWERVEDNWREAEGIAKRMAAIARNHTSADTLDHNPKACRKFGGCPHAAYCKASPLNRDKKPIPEEARVSDANTEEVKDRLAALRAKFNLDKPVPTAKPPAPDITPAPPPTSGGVEQAVAKLRGVVSKLGRVPESILVSTAAQAGAQPFEVMEALGLRKDGSFFVPRPEKEEAKEGPTLKTGMSLSDVLALCKEAGVEVQPTLAAQGLDTKYGMVVPAGWEGTLEETTLSFSEDPIRRKWAEESLLAKSEVKAAEASAPAPSGDHDALDIEAARAVYRAVSNTKKGKMTKAKAAVVVKTVHTDLERIRAGRWEAVIEASDGHLDLQGNYVVLSGNEAPAEPPTPGEVDVLAGSREVLVTYVDAQGEPAEPDKTQRFTREQALKEAEAAGLTVKDPPAPAPAPPLMEVGFPGPKASLPVQSHTVYIDAIPLDGEYTDFAEWVRPFEEEVAEEAGVVHYATIPYNQGPGRVAALVKARLHEEGPEALPSGLYLNSWHPLAPVVLPLFQRLQGVVRFIKGLK